MKKQPPKPKLTYVADVDGDLHVYTLRDGKVHLHVCAKRDFKDAASLYMCLNIGDGMREKIEEAHEYFDVPLGGKNAE